MMRLPNQYLFLAMLNPSWDPPSFDPQDCDALCKMDWLSKFLLSGAHLIFKFSSCFMMLIQRQRTQVNGKILEDGNNVHVDTQINGT